MNVIYRPNVLDTLTGNTNNYVYANSAITSDIYIKSGFTFNLNNFYGKTINRLDIIDNIINYVSDGISKYMLRVLIVSTGETLINVDEIGTYCVKISYNEDVVDYFIMNIGLTSITTTTTTINITTTTTTIQNDRSPFIFYNSGSSWFGSGLTIPYDVFLHLVNYSITGWTIDSLKILFINNVIDCYDGNIDLSEIILKLFKNNLEFNSISEFGIYDIFISVTDSGNNTTTNIIKNIVVDDLPPIIRYYNVLNNLTGNTTDYSGSSSAITSGVYIARGFTVSLNNTVNRLFIINSIVESVYDMIDNTLNKYKLNVLIVNSGETLIEVDNVGTYCVKISMSDNSGNETIDYLMMNVLLLPITTTTTTIIPVTTTTTTTILNGPYIFYNSGTSWFGSGLTVPYDVILPFVHEGVSGWTLDSLKMLFIDKVIDCYDGNISLSSITLILYNIGSIIPLSDIFGSGLYDIFVSFTNSSNNNVTNYIKNIKVDNSPPVIVYRPYVLVSTLTGNTTSFSGASSAITSGIYISSGFTANINGFDRFTIDRIGIIDNIVNYTYDDIDNINKYMLNVLVVGWAHLDTYDNIIYTEVNKEGYYCVKLSISDSSGNEVINYIMMKVIYDISVYSEGYWQDNKVWIDRILWNDHPFN